LGNKDSFDQGRLKEREGFLNCWTPLSKSCSIFWQKNYFYFSIIISQELIVANLLIIKAVLNPFSVTCHV
jgi:hypothetical protein